MSKIIRQCCVCGTIMGAITQQDGSDVEKISHGYCGKDCAAQTPVQLMLWNDKLGCATLDAGNQIADGRIFFHMEMIDCLVTINKKERRIEHLFWNDVMYELAEFETFTTEEHGNRLIKDAARAGNTVVL